MSGGDLIFFLFLLISRVLRHRPLLPIGRRILQTVRQKRGKLTVLLRRHSLLVRHLQQGKQLSSLVNYTPHVNSSRYKNKPLTLSSLVLNARNTFLSKGGASEKLKNLPQPLFKPRSVYTCMCHQKSNQSGDPAPLSLGKVLLVLDLQLSRVSS